MPNRFIVAEVSKNWRSSEEKGLSLGQRFEVVIQTNLERGYDLKDWKIDTHVFESVVNETIIAIFEKQPVSK